MMPRTGRSRSAIAATAVLVLLALTALAGPALVGRSATESGDLQRDKLLAPSAAHPFGTDANARDVLARVVGGTSVSLGVAAMSVGIILLVGVLWGGVAGLAPATTDRWMMRFVDALLATPRLLIVLAVVAFTGRLGAPELALVLGLTGWPPMSRVVRGRVRELRAADHVVAARALGTPAAEVFRRHILPGVAPAVLVTAIVALASVIPLEASLSYIGAGIAPPTPSWGVMLRDATNRPLDAWWLLLFPSAAITATVMSVNILGERLQPGGRSFLAR
jgi:peptide/nickel transport system permease protein